MKSWLSIKSIALEYADLSERKLREFLGHPTHPLPARLVGGKWLIHRHEFDEWLRGFPRAGEDIDALVDEVVRDVQRRTND
jgi:hypothetical protein